MHRPPAPARSRGSIQSPQHRTTRRANLAVVAIPLILAAGNANLKIGDFEINNLGLGALSAIIIWQIVRRGHMAEGGDTGKNIFADGGDTEKKALVPEAVVADA